MKNDAGQVCDFEAYDDRGNLTQKKLFNIYFDVYNIDTYTYNEKNQLIEKHIDNKYRKKEFTQVYTYDIHGNTTRSYSKEDGELFLTQHTVYEYYD